MGHSENSSNEDLLWIYWHVISLAYSIDSWFFDNSTIWLTWEWWNWKSTIMWLTKKLIKKEYDEKYLIVDINPWEYNENVDFFDILLKEFASINNNHRNINTYIIFFIVLLLSSILYYVKDYIIWFIELYQNNIFWIISLTTISVIVTIWSWVLKNKDTLFVLYRKSNYWFIQDYLKIWEKKDRFLNIIANKIKDNQKIIFFIDDLDRCAPKQVINILKTIVLFWNQKNSIFILWYDEKIIIENLKKELNLSNDENENKIKSYIEKIINLQVSIPQIDRNDISNYIDWNFNNKNFFNIENLELPLKFLNEKKEFINKQFENVDFKNDLFDLIHSKTPRWIKTWYKTVYYDFIYLIVLQSYWYINFEPDINLLLKASILKQKFWKEFNKILLKENYINILYSMYKILNYKKEINNFKFLFKNLGLDNDNFFDINIFNNIIRDISKRFFDIRVLVDNSIQNYSKDKNNLLNKKDWENIENRNQKISNLIEIEKLLKKYLEYIDNFRKNENIKNIKSNIDNYYNFDNELILIKLFDFEELELENFINYYYNPPKINNWLLISFININNKQIDLKKIKELLSKYIDLKDKDYEESEKIMFFLSKNLILEKKKVNNLYKVKKVFIEIKEDKVFFWKLIEKIVSDLEKYFEKNKNNFNSSEENNKRYYSSFENMKDVVIAISRLLDLSNIENINIRLFGNDSLKKYFKLLLKLNLHHKIREIWDIMLLDSFNPWLLKYYDTINKSINSWIWNKFLNDYLIKNKNNLSEKKKEILWIS